MAEVTWEWLAGFHEGEGCFTQLQKHNNTTRNGERWYYKRFQPQWVCSQVDRRILDLIAGFLIEEGITARVWRKSNLPHESHKWEVRVVGWKNCRRMAALIRPHMRAPHKLEQLDRWLTLLAEAKPTGKVDDALLLRRVG